VAVNRITLPWRRSGAARAGEDPDAELLERLRAGEQDAFMAIVERHQAALMRLARSFVPTAAVAEEVTQETWLAVLRGLDGFAGRSTFKTWLFQILVNRARSTGVRERRSVPFGERGPSVDPARFDASGAWATPPIHWVERVEERLDAQALSQTLDGALARLPAAQREVVVLRDVEQLTGPEVCDVLAISDANQRVLLHRGRTRLREAIEARVEEGL
jgi:RNA polymerase sigma-70 factor, ECF subfamily